MTWQSKNAVAQDGDLAEIVGLRHQHFIIKLKPGEELHTHRGIVRHDDLIGKPWGSQFFSHNGNPFFLLQPGLSDIIRSIPRSTQIMYPKDIGFMLVYMGIGPGRICVEAGTGSGSMTAALAFAVGDTGKVISYEINPDFQSIALKNLQRLGLDHRVILKTRDIRDGFDEKDVDVLFLDVQYPYDYIQQVKETLKPGGFFCSIVPTTNKVVLLLDALKREKFGFIEVCEVLLRYYKSDAEHFRPTDRMVAHTGYIVFARPMIIENETIPDCSLEKFDLE